MDVEVIVRQPSHPDRSKTQGGRALMRQTRAGLEFETVLGYFERHCQTQEGRTRLRALAPMNPTEQKDHYRELGEWQSYLSANPLLRLPVIPEATLFERNPHLKPFDAEELKILNRLLQVWLEIAANEKLAFTTGGWTSDDGLKNLSRRLNSLFDQDGDWDQNVSPIYARLIRAWVDLDRQIQANLTGLLRRFSPYLNEEIVYERNRRRVLPVKVDFRGRVKGIVHDYSSSGNTIFIEPEETVANQNKLTEIESEIREELWRIRVEVSGEILAFDEIPERICPILARADMMQALCKTATETGCQAIEPNQQRRLDLWQARHPFLCARFAKARMDLAGAAEPDQNQMIAFSLCLEDELCGLVISGANTGGKTVTLKTTGLLAWMANSGLPVPADERTQIPYYHSILADIGDNQSLSHNLSTFASHLANIKEVLEAPEGATLVLLDELGSGTDPAEGNALGQAILDELCKRRYHLLVTTHQQILCTMALTHPNLENGSMVFDPNRHKPTYRFTQGVPGRSHALDIARGAGLPDHILAAATALIDSDLVDIQAAIRILQQQFKEMDKQKQKLRNDELRLHRRIKEAREQGESLKREQESFKEQSRIRLQKEVEKAERELRKTLSEVSGTKARTAVATFARTRNEVLRPFQEPEKINEEAIPSSGLAADRWRPGDKVYLRSWRREGKIISLDRKKARLEVDGKRMEMNLDDLIHLPKEVHEKSGRVSDHLEESSDAALSVELRLLGFRVEDGLLELDQAIDLALRRGTPFLKIIHGHGHGALKQAIREFLRRHQAKSSFEVVLDQENDGTTELKFT